MNTPFAILLTKFLDNDAEPYPRARYEEIFTTAGAGKWNMTDFFRDMSHGQLDLSGSQVFGWFQLNQKRSDYVGSGANPQGRLDLIQWARDKAVSEGVKLDSFFSVVVVLNRVDGDLFGGPTGACTSDDGQFFFQSAMSPSLMGQEMGHVYGLQHSRRFGTLDDYTDPYDVMSTRTNTMVAHPVYKERLKTDGSPAFVIGPGLNASNMDAMGWLDEARVWTGSILTKTSETITLRPLHRHDLPGFLAMRIGGFTVEFRVREGWDAGFGPGVLVHRLDDGISYAVPDSAGNLLYGVDSTLTAPFSLRVMAVDPGNRAATIHVEWEGAHLPDVPRDWPKTGPYQTPWIKWLEESMIDRALVVVDGRAVTIRKGSPMYGLLTNVALFESANAQMSSRLKSAIRHEALTQIATQAQAANRTVSSPNVLRIERRRADD